MTPASRLAMGLAAGLANGCLLLAPVLVLRGGAHLGIEIFAVLVLSLAVAVEVICAVVLVYSHNDFDVLNWAQGLTLLAGFEVELLWSRHNTSVAFFAIGGLAILMGAALRCMAILKLGGGFTNTSRPATGALCDDGIYAWLRHPAETGLLCIAAGFPLAVGAWAAMAWALPPLFVLSLLRIKAEEQGLARAFPEAHQAYATRLRF